MSKATKGYRVTHITKSRFGRFLHARGGKIGDHISRGVALLEADKGRTLSRAVVAHGAGWRGAKSSHQVFGAHLGTTWATLSTSYPTDLIRRIKVLAETHGCSEGAVVEAAINKVVSYPETPDAIRGLCGHLNRNGMIASLPNDGGGHLPQQEANVFADHSVFAAALFKGIASPLTESSAALFIDRIIAQSVRTYTNTHELSLLMEMLSVSGNEGAIPTVANFFIVYCPAFPVFAEDMVIKDRATSGVPLGVRLAFQTVATARMGSTLLTATPDSYELLTSDECEAAATSVALWGI